MTPIVRAPSPRNVRRRLLPYALLLFALCLVPSPAAPYSVQTHEQIIDLTWQRTIRPLLLSRYPNLTPEQLKEAHAFAYGGCAIQDMGYYPFSQMFFSDLTHYVRSGDFIIALFRESRTANELAFAIGALSHFIADNIGHPAAVNIAVPVEFPDLEQRYGPVVNYAQGKHQHVRTEFAFDINELSKERLAPSKYLEHVGLRIPQPLLEKAFFQTYGLEMRRDLHFRGRMIDGYRFAVRSFIPKIADAELLLHKKDFPADTPGAPLDQLKAELTQADFENGWSTYRHKPGFGAHLFAAFIFILPKVGVLSDLSVRGPSVKTQEDYVESLNRAVEFFRNTLTHYSAIPTAIPNRDLDTGAKVRPGGYILTDQTYARLLDLLVTRYAKGPTQSNPTQTIPTGLKEDLLAYYADPDAPITTKKNPARWAKVQSQLAILTNMKDTPNPPFVPGPDPDLTASTQLQAPPLSPPTSSPALPSALSASVLSLSPVPIHLSNRHHPTHNPIARPANRCRRHLQPDLRPILTLVAEHLFADPFARLHRPHQRMPSRLHPNSLSVEQSTHR